MALPVFFVDRTFGRYTVVNELRLNGITAEAHDDHFERDCDDAMWMAHAGALHWAVLTEDGDLKDKIPWLQLIKRFNLAVFVVRARNLRGTQAAMLVVKAIPRIEKFFAEHEPPFVAGIFRGTPRVRLLRKFKTTRKK